MNSDTSSNYFKNILPKIEENDKFYDYLLNFIEINKIYDNNTIVDKLMNYFQNVDMSSDFDEIFIQVYDQDLSNQYNCRPITILILLYNKLGVNLEDETKSEFLNTINSENTNGHLDNEENDIKEQIEKKNNIIKENQKIIRDFLESNNIKYEISPSYYVLPNKNDEDDENDDGEM